MRIVEGRDWGVVTIAEEWTVVNVDPLNTFQTAHVLVRNFEGFTLRHEEWASGW